MNRSFRDPELARGLLRRIEKDAPRETIQLMEVCGTHTMAIFRHGIRRMLPSTVRLISGPGCPVCVTPIAFIDRAIALSRLPHIRLATFGDLIRVPGSASSLEEEIARGADVRSVYSPLDALELASGSPEKTVVFLGVGFETTTPTVAASILAAKARKIENFKVLAANKVMPAPLRALVSEGAVRIDGLLCPGNVSAVIGPEAYRFLAEEFGIPCAVAGFEPIEILGAISALLAQRKEGIARVENFYGRVVKPEGNPKARAVVAEVFEPDDAEWRGLGSLPGSGLKIRKEFESFDAGRIDVEVPMCREPRGCRCGEILKGLIRPRECPLFGKTCTPERPVGACMVSSEGSCAAAFRYGEEIINV